MVRTMLVLALFLCGSRALAAEARAPEAFFVRHLELGLRIDYEQQRLAGEAVCELENQSGAPSDHVSLLLNRLMEASSVRDGAGRPLSYAQDVVRFEDNPMRQVTQLRVRLARPVPQGGRTKVRVAYAGNLVGFTEGGWLYVRDQIDTSFTILRWEGLAFPVVAGRCDSLNRSVSSRHFTYDVSIRVPAHYVVATGGRPSRTAHPDGSVTWRYESLKQSPFLNVCIAPFDTLSAGNVRVFYFAADSAGARRLLSKAGAALETYAQWFGPLREQPDLCITEIPDGWGSQADAVGGIIQTAAAFRDPRRLRELYHEISHLWNVPDTELAPSRWNEGLASFLEDLMQERLDEWKGRASSDSSLIAGLKKRLAADSSLRTVPFLDYGKRQMTGRSYSVGDILFATLFAVLGETEFDRVVGGYYQQFPQGGTTRDFVEFAKAATTRDVSAVFDDWIYTTRWSSLVANARSVEELAAHYRNSN